MEEISLTTHWQRIMIRVAASRRSSQAVLGRFKGGYIRRGAVSQSGPEFLVDAGE